MSTEDILAQFKKQLAETHEPNEVLNVKAQFVGKKGMVTEKLKGLKELSEEERRVVGPQLNTIKDQINEWTTQKIKELEIYQFNKKMISEKIDITLRDSIREIGQNSGGYHPLTAIQREIEDIFISMGFEILDGPHIEDEYHNFIALNTPSDHPARDMQDTFWFHDPHSDQEKKYLLRTHTSCIQARGMRTRKPPFRFIAPGKVFRCERTDASHEMIFHQTEGMLVGENISVANLIYFMKTLLSEIFQKSIEIRLRPGFFPFVEPGFELDIKCLICGGKGCSVCKQIGWVELLPCGMVHPNLFKLANIDSTRFNGFAFGLGLDRLVMMRYGIDDIRHINSGDLRFINQFKSF
jgi:phenylalanyl-tRNA synthetase alpha chain